MSLLILEYSAVSDQDALSATGGIYAMVFHHHDGTALDFDAPPYSLSAFDGDQDEFSIPLVHRTPRTRYYSEVISSVDLSLPDNGDGEQYYIEYWGKRITAATPNRTNDRLLKVDKFSWHDQMKPVSRLSLGQVEDIVDAMNLPPEIGGPDWTVHSAFSYDPETVRIGIVLWLEKDGAIKTDALQASYELVDSEELVVASGSSGSINARGEFQLDFIPTAEDIHPDETYFASVQIIDADGVIHQSGAGVVTWD